MNTTHEPTVRAGLDIEAGPAPPQIHVTVIRERLLHALTRACSIALRPIKTGRRRSSPADRTLSWVRLRADVTGLFVTSTNLDQAAVERVPAEVEIGGVIVTPAHALRDTVRACPPGSSVTICGRHLSCEGVTADLGTLDPEDFPLLTSSPISHRFVVGALALRGLIDRTRFAISTEETRYYLNGIYLHVAESEDARVLRAVATDGHQLALAETETLPEGAAGMPGIILPKEMVELLRTALAKVPRRIEVAVSATRIEVAIGDLVLHSKLIDGSFPDYRRVMPTVRDNSLVLTVGRKALDVAVERCAVSRERTCAVALVMEPGCSVKVMSYSSEGGAAVSAVVPSNFTGVDPLRITFQARYLRNVLGAMLGLHVELRFYLGKECKSAEHPVLIREPGERSDTYVLMPERLEIAK